MAKREVKEETGDGGVQSNGISKRRKIFNADFNAKCFNAECATSQFAMDKRHRCC